MEESMRFGMRGKGVIRAPPKKINRGSLKMTIVIIYMDSSRASFWKLVEAWDR
jgi:hypothetical protein